MGLHYAHTLRLWREQFVANWQHVQAARLRRPVLPDVGVLPRLLRGRVPHRLPRRGADPHRALTRWAGRRSSRSAPDGDGPRDQVVQAAAVPVVDHRRDDQADQQGAQQRPPAGSPGGRRGGRRRPAAAAGRTSPPTSGGQQAALDQEHQQRQPRLPAVGGQHAPGRRSTPATRIEANQSTNSARIRRPQLATLPRPVSGRPSRWPAYDAAAGVGRKAHGLTLSGGPAPAVGWSAGPGGSRNSVTWTKQRGYSEKLPAHRLRVSGAEPHRASA